SDTTAVSDSGPRLLAITTGRPARWAVRAIAWPMRPAPMIPTWLRSPLSMTFLSVPPHGPARARSLGLRRGLHPRKFEHRNAADSGGLARILGEAWIAPCLLGEDAVAFSTGHLADCHLVGL